MICKWSIIADNIKFINDYRFDRNGKEIVK
jgi:hypothetical protein